ncbi:MAG: DNA topoisomerase I [Coriobacteriia bacterium]|nr:DNA topoisomerase I [Coriobacteriia bacterium]
MRLVVSEKNIAARRIAEILAVGKPKAEKVYSTPVYRFRRDGEEWASVGLKGHILKVDFPALLEREDGEWVAHWDDDRETPAELPDYLAAPPWPSPVKKPFTKGGVDLKTWKLASLPYLTWAPIGKTPAEREIVRALKTLAKKADEVVIATDYDREGELIGADARGLVREVNPDVPVKRARFSAITRGEIERAFSELGEVSDWLAQAGEARQDIDLVWGAVLTRYLTKVRFSGVGQPRSAGRVQTPTLKLIVDREKEREAFVPETYWTVKGTFASDGEEFTAGHVTERFKRRQDAEAVMEAVVGESEATVAAVDRSRRTVRPAAPFNTTGLQAAAAAEGLSPARTMRIAESLYMDGLISYPRVDNTVYPESLDLRAILRTLDGVPQYHEHVARLLASEKLTATRGGKEATDHPPVHPTGAADPDRLKPEGWKLYNLVARRFMATLSEPAVIEGTKVSLEVDGETFVTRGDVLVVPGFRSVYPYGAKKDEELPAMAEGGTVAFLGAAQEEKQTQPPARYSQGKLIQEMEKRGLGTKATRHEIVQRLYDRRYIVNDPAEPTCLGITVIDALSAFADRITTPEMTSELESEMDAIANGRADRTDVVEHSRKLLDEAMAQLLPRAGEVGELLKNAAVEDARIGTCPRSGHDLLVKSSPKTKGQFVGCAGWPECEVTYPLPQGKVEPVEEPCPVCATPQVRIVQFRRPPLVRCLDPNCATNVEPPIDLGECPKCAEEGREGGRLVGQRSPRTLKRFVRCVNYEECKVSYPLPQSGEIQLTGEKCTGCGAPEIVVQTRRGPWRICIDPACPTRPPAEGAKGGRKTSSRRRAKR